jgi:hypothetical protein
MERGRGRLTMLGRLLKKMKIGLGVQLSQTTEDLVSREHEALGRYI